MGDRPNEALVLLPGLLCDAALWQHQSSALADIARVQVADFTGADRIGALARAVLAAAPETFSLAGLSMGGYVAFEILRQAPDRVRRLALIATAAGLDPPAKAAERRAMVDLAGSGEFRGVTRRLLPQLVHPIHAANPTLAGTIFAMAERMGRDVFIRQERAILNRPDSRHDLGLIHCPTLIVCGRQDALTPLAASQEMAEKVRRAALVIIEDCGHLPPLEQPHAVSALLRYWLQL